MAFHFSNLLLMAYVPSAERNLFNFGHHDYDRSALLSVESTFITVAAGKKNNKKKTPLITDVPLLCRLNNAVPR